MRESARRSLCAANLKQLALALQAYHDEHDSFPPTYIADEDGKPMHSWRVLILPYIEGGHLYDQYRFEEPWNSVNNLGVARQALPLLSCPSYAGPTYDNDHSDAAVTNYVAVVGPNSIFRGVEATTIDDILDGPSQTILLVDVANRSVPWAAPIDITTEQFIAAVTDEQDHNHHTGTVAVFADRNTRLLASDTSLELLEAMTTTSAGDKVADFAE